MGTSAAGTGDDLPQSSVSMCREFSDHGVYRDTHGRWGLLTRDQTQLATSRINAFFSDAIFPFSISNDPSEVHGSSPRRSMGRLEEKSRWWFRSSDKKGQLKLQQTSEFWFAGRDCGGGRFLQLIEKKRTAIREKEAEQQQVRTAGGNRTQ